jgi:hypothetical protein
LEDGDWKIHRVVIVIRGSPGFVAGATQIAVARTLGPIPVLLPEKETNMEMRGAV